MKGIIINFLPPLIGLVYFVMLCGDMKSEKIEDPPVLPLFVTFFNYGGLLMVFITSQFWQWSGMASLGSLYLITGAPVSMAIVAYAQYRKQHISGYHRWAYYMAVAYFVVAPVTIIALVASSGH